MVEKQGKVTTEWNQSLAIKTLEKKPETEIKSVLN